MNFALILLWLIVLAVCGLLVWISITTQIKWFSPKANPISIIPVGKCIIATNSVPDVSTDPYCVANGITTGYRYDSAITLGENLTTGVVISTVPTYYGTVCSEFCSSGIDPSNPGHCNGGIGQDNYEICVQRLRPVGCTDPALPVGYDNRFGNWYYIAHIGNSTCQVTRPA